MQGHFVSQKWKVKSQKYNFKFKTNDTESHEENPVYTFNFLI